MIKLGEEVVDIITGFKGIAISNTKYLHGCNIIMVQPKVLKDGSLPGACTFNEPDLKVIKKNQRKNLGFHKQGR